MRSRCPCLAGTVTHSRGNAGCVAQLYPVLDPRGWTRKELWQGGRNCRLFIFSLEISIHVEYLPPINVTSTFVTYPEPISSFISVTTTLEVARTSTGHYHRHLNVLPSSSLLQRTPARNHLLISSSLFLSTYSYRRECLFIVFPSLDTQLLENKSVCGVFCYSFQNIVDVQWKCLD